MTQSPAEGKCANPAGGLCGMPLALRLSEGLGADARSMRVTLRRPWTRQMVEARIALVCACLALALQLFALTLTVVRVSGTEAQYRFVVGLLLEGAHLLSPSWACQTTAGRYQQQLERCSLEERPLK